MAHVFISYVREDEKEVGELCNNLRTAGIEYWLDKEQLKPGTYWPLAISEAIQNGVFFLACFSKNSEKIEKSYMREEICIAAEAAKLLPVDKKWIIPIKFSECQIPPYNLGAGRSLKQVQYVNLFKNWEKGVHDIIGTIQTTTAQTDTKSKTSLTRDEEMLVIFTHEFRNVLVLLEASSQMIRRNAEAGKPIEKYLNMMEQGIMCSRNLMDYTINSFKTHASEKKNN